MRSILRGNAIPDTPLFINARIRAVVVLILMSCTIVAVPRASLGATEERDEHAARSSVYKGEVVVYETTNLVMKDSNGQRIELHLGPDTLLKGRPGVPFRPGDFIEAEVTPEGHAKRIGPMR